MRTISADNLIVRFLYSMRSFSA